MHTSDVGYANVVDDIDVGGAVDTCDEDAGE